MSTELIRAVKIKPDGVYLNSKSNNDDLPFRDWKCESLTDIYNQEGQQGLDREMVRMLYEYASIQGSHPSMERYRPCMNSWGTLGKPFVKTIRAEYEKLSPEDKATIGFPEERQTDGAKAYAAFRKNTENDLYTRLAMLAKPLDNAIENLDYGIYDFDCSAGIDDDDLEV